MIKNVKRQIPTDKGDDWAKDENNIFFIPDVIRFYPEQNKLYQHCYQIRESRTNPTKERYHKNITKYINQESNKKNIENHSESSL